MNFYKNPQSQYSEFQQNIINGAIELLRNRSWFKGVCLDTLPMHPDESKLGEYIDTMVTDTMYYDCPHSS